MEYRDNKAFPIKTLERLAVFEDKDDPEYLSELMEEWAGDTAKSLAVTMHISKKDMKELRKSAIRSMIAEKDGAR
jgi:hypothetical protein